MRKIDQINRVLRTFFEKNPSVKSIPAKDMMEAFIRAGVFKSDRRNGLPIREILRDLDAENRLHEIPYTHPVRKDVNTNWFFIPVGSSPKTVPAAQSEKKPVTKPKNQKPSSGRDEEYVLNLCDKVLGLKGSRQHKFDFLTGDSGHKLPVDIYYESLNLVIEYREKQHFKAVKHFDKPDKLTVSGVPRSEQRKIYDQRRRDVLPKHNIKLIEINYTDFKPDSKDKIIRNPEEDLEVVRGMLEELATKEQ